MTDLPDPLTPADCNLRDFQFMPMDVARLLASETWVLGTGDERAAAMTLWLESWRQVPAGSVPTDDRMLAHMSQSKAWKKVRTHALRGWIEASDGRLYHPVVAEKVLEAWIEKLAFSLSGSAGNAKRWGIEIETAGIRERVIAACDMLRALAPQSKTLKKKAVLIITAGSPPDQNTSPPESPPDDPKASPPDRKGYVVRDKLDTLEPKGSSPAPDDSHSASAVGTLCIAMRAAGIQAQPADPRMIALADQGVQTETVTAACDEAKRVKPGERIPPGFVLAILERWAREAAELKVNGAEAPAPRPVREDWTWKKTDQGCNTEGAKFGLRARGGESRDSFIGRIEVEKLKRKGQP